MSAEESDLKLNQTVFFSPFLSQRQILSPLDFIQEKGKHGYSYLLHPQPKLFARRMSWFFVERFFQTVGLVLAWGTFTGWRVLYREVFIRACQFRDNVLCCCSKTSVQKRGSKLIKRFKGSKLLYGSYVERFKVNKIVQRFKVTHATKKS